MAWRDQYHEQGYVWVHEPAIVFQGTVDAVGPGAGGGAGNNWIRIDTTTYGSLSDIKANMTVALGSSADTYDLGRARVHFTYNDGVDDFIYMHAASHYHDGEMYAVGADHVTVYDERRIWLKPPYADTSGNYYYAYPDAVSPGTAPDGKTYDQKPIANCGAGYIDFVDSTTGAYTVTLDASNSYAVADDAVFGGYSAGEFSGGETLFHDGIKVTDDFSNPANAIDSNSATYATGIADYDANASGSWLGYDFGDGNDTAVRKFDIESDGTYAPKVFMLQWSDDDSNYVTAFHGYETGWGSTESRTFYVHHVGVHRYWRLFFFENNGAASGELRIHEMQWYTEDRTAAAYCSWDVGDGVITSGTSTSESLTVEFPPGVRYVELTVTDTNTTEGVTDCIVVALDTTKTGSYTAELWYGASTITASNEVNGAAERAYDNRTDRSWATGTGVTTGWNQIQLPIAKQADSYGLQVSGTTYAPTDWTLLGSNNGADYDTLDTQSDITDWESLVEKTYSISSPDTYLYYKINVTANNGGNLLSITELNLYGSEPSYTNADPIDSIAVTSHTIEPAGQIMEFTLHSDLAASDAHDGALVMYFEKEYYDNTEGSLSAAGPTGREHIKFIGWIDEEDTEIAAEDGNIEQTTILRCLDAGQRLNQLGMFPIMAVKDAAPSAGYEMKHANIDTLTYLLVRWLSTAAEVTDFFWSNTADHYLFGLLATEGSSLYEAIQHNARAIDHNFICTKSGDLKMEPDLLTATGATTANASTTETLTAADYTRVRYLRQHTSRYSWVEGSGVWCLGFDADHGSFDVNPVFTITPGQIPGQGASTDTDHEQVGSFDYNPSDSYPYWSDIHERNGRAYAQRASVVSTFEIELVHAGDTGIGALDGNWLKLTLPASVAAQRGLTLSAQEGVVRRVDVVYDHDAMTKTVTLEWERQEAALTAWGYP